MSLSLPGSGKYRRKPADTELNLVPYIDLLTCMIAFLLITAVWTQVARLEVSRRTPGGTDETELPQMRMVVMVGEEGFNVVVGAERQILPRRAGLYDFETLAAALKKVKAEHPDRDDALVSSEDHITYETLTATMDTVLGAGFPAVSLVDAAAAP
jgi:biopolymer transport protein TolR